MAAAIANQIGEDVAAILTPLVTSIEGRRYDVEALGNLPRPSHCPLIVDAAQGLGQTEVDVRQLGCDVLVATTRKWLRGPRGMALLYVSQPAVAMMHPNPAPELAGLRLDRETQRFLDLPQARRFDASDVSIMNQVTLTTAINELQQITLEALREHLTTLTERIYELARDPGGRDIHHDVMKFLEESGLSLLCHVGSDDFTAMLAETHPEGQDHCAEAGITEKIPF